MTWVEHQLHSSATSDKAGNNMPSMLSEDTTMLMCQTTTMLMCRTVALTSFYHGHIDRAESEKRLRAYSKQDSKSGQRSLYLVRKSDRMGGAFVLSYMGRTSSFSHFVIAKTPEDRLCLGGLLFNSLHEMVTYYSTPGADLLKDEWLEVPVPFLEEYKKADDDQNSMDELAQLHQTTEKSRQGVQKGSVIYKVAEGKGFKPRSIHDLTNRRSATLPKGLTFSTCQNSLIV